MAMVQAYIKSNEPFRAEVLLNRLYNLNFANFRRHIDIRPINALLDSYLQTDSAEPSSRLSGETEKAWKLYKSIPNYGLKPDIVTFATMSLYCVRTNDTKTLQAIITDMTNYKIDVDNLFNHPHFESPLESASLSSMLSSLGIKTAVRGPLGANNDLLASVLQDANSETSKNAIKTITASLLENNESAAIPSTPAVGVKLLEKSLQKFLEMQEESDTYKLQEQLEAESQKLSFLEREEHRESLPGYLQQMNGVSKNLIVEWHSAMLPYIRLELKSHPSGVSKNTASKDLHVPFLRTLKPEQLALITITEFLQAPTSKEIDSGVFFGEIKLSQLAIQIGRAVQKESNAQYYAKRTSKNVVAYQKKLHSLHSEGKLFDSKLRKAALDMARHQLSQNPDWLPEVPAHVLAAIGTTLAAILVQVAKIKVKHPDPVNRNRYL